MFTLSFLILAHGAASVDRITSDCHGNQKESQTVTIDECQFEQFPNGDPRPFKYFCDDNNQLGLKYYTRGVNTNCDGAVQLQTILDSAECRDGLIFSSTCGEIMPTQQCNHFNGMPMNRCIVYSLPDAPQQVAIKYVCTDSNTAETRYYSDVNCDGDQYMPSNTLDCTLEENGCYCAATGETVCDSVDATITYCEEKSQIPHTFLVDQCIHDASGVSSYSYHCNNNGELEYKTYHDNLNCQSSPSTTEMSFPTSCVDDPNAMIAITCGGITVITPETPTSTIVSRLCTEELQQFNKGAIFTSTGGCAQHFSAIVYQDKTGSATFKDCVAKCEEEPKCKSFSFGRKGVDRENWCNIYSVECSIGTDNDWYMFTPINNAELMCNSNPL